MIKNDNKDVNNDDNSRGVNHFFHERLLIKSQLSMPVKATVLKGETHSRQPDGRLNRRRLVVL